MNIIIRPIITEKAINEVSKGKFTFEVEKNADKNNIKKAIEDKFKVNVEKVYTTIVKAKKIRTGRKRIEIAKSAWKKAVVKLKTGQKIDLFEVGGSK